MMNHETTFDSILKAEAYVSASDLISEINPLIEDYFEGEMRFDGQDVVYKLPNGQAFIFAARAL